MKEDTIQKVNTFFSQNPIAKGIPANQKQIEDAEEELGIKFDDDYVFFLLNYGGSMIGSAEIYGLTNNPELMDDTNIVELTEAYRDENENESDWLIIGSDYSGNSIGINKEGEVITYDHDLAEYFILANSFEEYILKSLQE